MSNFSFLRLRTLAVLLAIFCSAMQLQAQSTFANPGSAASAETDITRAIEQATENGLSVIVIDTDGNVLSGGAKPVREEAEINAGSSLMKAQESANAFRSALFERLAELPAAINEVLYILRASSPDGTIWAYFKALLISLGLFAIGMLAEKEIYGKRIAAHFILPRIKQDPIGYSEKVPFLVIRFLAGVIGTAFSMLVAYLIGIAVFGTIADSAMQYTVTLINIGYFSVRIIAGLWRMILSPYLSQYRIPHLSDADAHKLHVWLSVVVSAGFFALLFGAWIQELGLNKEVYVFLTSLLSFGVVLLNVVLIFSNRRAISNAILNGEPQSEASFPLRFLALSWVPLALIYLAFAWGERTYDLVLDHPQGVPLLPGAYAILTTMFIVYGLINFLIERSFAKARAIRSLNALDADSELPFDDITDDEPTPDIVHPRPQITTFEDLARRVAGILAGVAGVYAFVSFWNPNTNTMGDSLPDRTLDVIVILFIGYITYQAFRVWIDAKIREEEGELVEAELGDEGGGSSASRLATLLPLFRNVVLIVIIITVLLIIMMELGVNVGPLFAGAGVVGVAIGFGSQSLVRDIVSGAFFLFDDAFRKGEYIDIGGVKGTVEKISVRSFQLRHHLGALHTIPFGEIQVITNFSRDWVMMKLPLRVTYDTDVDHVRKLVKKLGQQLLEDPEIGDQFIQPLKSQGVIEMQDSAMIIRVKFMTEPGNQWVIRKRVYQEIRALFEREGIKFAHREVTVRLADGDPAKLSEDQKEAVMAAAEASIEEDILDAATDMDDDR